MLELVGRKLSVKRQETLRLKKFSLSENLFIKKARWNRWDEQLKQFSPLRMSDQINARNTDCYLHITYI